MVFPHLQGFPHVTVEVLLENFQISSLHLTHTTISDTGLVSGSTKTATRCRVHWLFCYKQGGNRAYS